MKRSVRELQIGDTIKLGSQYKTVNSRTQTSDKATTLVFEDGTYLCALHDDVFEIHRPNKNIELTADELDMLAELSSRVVGDSRYTRRRFADSLLRKAEDAGGSIRRKLDSDIRGDIRVLRQD